MCMVFETLGDNLLALIKAYKYKGIPVDLVRKITRQVCFALDFLHRKCRLIHTDLKPENVLLTHKLPPVPLRPSELEGCVETEVELSPAELAAAYERDRMLARKLGVPPPPKPSKAASKEGGRGAAGDADDEGAAVEDPALAGLTGAERAKARKRLAKKRKAAAAKAAPDAVPVSMECARASLSQAHATLTLCANFVRVAGAALAAEGGARLRDASGGAIPADEEPAELVPAAMSSPMPGAAAAGDELADITDNPPPGATTVLVLARFELLRRLLALLSTDKASAAGVDSADLMLGGSELRLSIQGAAPGDSKASGGKAKRRGKRGGGGAKPAADVSAAASVVPIEVRLSALPLVAALPAADSAAAALLVRLQAGPLPLPSTGFCWYRLAVAQPELLAPALAVLEAALPSLAFLALPLLSLGESGNGEARALARLTPCQTHSPIGLAAGSDALSSLGVDVALVGVELIGALHTAAVSGAAAAAVTAGSSCPLIHSAVPPLTAPFSSGGGLGSSEAATAVCTRLRPLSQRLALAFSPIVPPAVAGAGGGTIAAISDFGRAAVATTRAAAAASVAVVKPSPSDAAAVLSSSDEIRAASLTLPPAPLASASIFESVRRTKRVKAARELSPEELEVAEARYDREFEEWERTVFSFDAKLVDLGNACWVHKHFSEDIQTRQYRAPEVITGAGYDESADVWSLACMTFELITGDLLFDPQAGDGWDRDEDHLAQMIELTGPYPKRLARAGRHSASLFNADGDLLHIHELRFWGPADVLVDKYGWDRLEAAMVEAFVLPGLHFDRRRRATAQEMLQHPWLAVLDDGSLIDFAAEPELTQRILASLAEEERRLGRAPHLRSAPGLDDGGGGHGDDDGVDDDEEAAAATDDDDDNAGEKGDDSARGGADEYDEGEQDTPHRASEESAGDASTRRPRAPVVDDSGSHHHGHHHGHRHHAAAGTEDGHGFGGSSNEDAGGEWLSAADAAALLDSLTPEEEEFAVEAMALLSHGSDGESGLGRDDCRLAVATEIARQRVAAARLPSSPDAGSSRASLLALLREGGDGATTGAASMAASAGEGGVGGVVKTFFSYLTGDGGGLNAHSGSGGALAAVPSGGDAGADLSTSDDAKGRRSAGDSEGEGESDGAGSDGMLGQLLRSLAALPMPSLGGWGSIATPSSPGIVDEETFRSPPAAAGGEGEASHEPRT